MGKFLGRKADDDGRISKYSSLDCYCDVTILISAKSGAQCRYGNALIKKVYVFKSL